MKKTLVLCPHIKERCGGVSYYYLLFQKYFSSERLSVEFFYTGEKKSNDNVVKRLFTSLIDLCILITKLPRYDLIVLNPSLDFRAVVRDGVYHFVAKRIFCRKTLVLFHGWDMEFERIIDSYGKDIFRFFYNFNRALVLARQFRNVLVRWGFSPESIGLETTIYEHTEFDTDKDPFKIIFLSRFATNKGCLEAIQAVEILVREFPRLRLYMVGDGELDQELKHYVLSRNLENNVEFTGWLSGTEKYSLLSQCGIMLFPTSYGEGMPISILEGMGMGLAVITRPVAGITDIFIDGQNGYLIQSTNPVDFAIKVKYLINDRALWQRIADTNKREAEERFEVRSVVKRIEQLYYEVAQ